MNTEFKIEDIRVLPQRNLLIKGQERLPLEPRIMEVMSYLAKHPREVVLRDDLITSIWSVQYGGDESLTRAISLLRKAFKKLGVQKQVIETIPKRGYRLAISPITQTETLETVKPVAERVLSTKDIPAQPTVTVAKPQATVQPVDPSHLSSGAEKIGPETKSVLNPLVPVLATAILCFGFFAVFLRLTSDPMPETTTQDRSIPGISSQIDYTQEDFNQDDDLPPIGSAASQDYEVKASQGDVATAIILTYLEGLIDKQTAIATASRHLKIAQSLTPNSSDTLTAEGWMHYIEEEPDKALLNFEIVTAREGLMGDAWLGKAYVFKDMGKKDLALLNFNRAIQVEVFSITPRQAKVQYLFDIGDFTEALEAANDLLVYYPNNQSVLDQVSKIKRKMK